MRERPIVGRIIGQSSLKLANLMVAESEVEAAKIQLRLGKDSLTALQEEYPEFPQLDDLIQECQTLLNELSE